MMPITPSTVLTSVVIRIDSENELEWIQARNGSSVVSSYNFLFGSWGRRFKPGNRDFDELDARIERGEISVIYDIRGHGEFQGHDALPAWAKTLVDLRDPFRKHTSTAAGAQGGNFGPVTEFWFKRGSTAPTLPDLSSYDENANTLESLMEGTGWERQPADGTDTLYYSRITRSVVNSVASISASTVTTGEIRFSTNDGDSFSSTPPAAGTVIDAIEVYIPGLDDWVEFSLRDAPVISPYARLGGGAWQNTGGQAINQYIGFPADTALLQDNYAVGLYIQKFPSWSSLTNPQYAGSINFPTAELKYIYPHELSNEANGQIGNRTYMITQNKETGAVTGGICDPGTALTAYDSAHWGSYKFVWLAFPKTTLGANLSATATAVIVSDASGIEVGDVVFAGDEQMSVTVIAGDTLTVTRGANGTTAASHDSGDTLRAVVNRDEIDKLAILGRNGVSSITLVQVFRMRKRGAN